MAFYVTGVNEEYIGNISLIYAKYVVGEYLGYILNRFCVVSHICPENKLIVS
jgi:hypothetical protein